MVSLKIFLDFVPLIYYYFSVCVIMPDYVEVSVTDTYFRGITYKMICQFT